MSGSIQFAHYLCKRFGPLALVAQSEEAVGLKPTRCGFESRQGYKILSIFEDEEKSE